MWDMVCGAREALSGSHMNLGANLEAKNYTVWSFDYTYVFRLWYIMIMYAYFFV